MDFVVRNNSNTSVVSVKVTFHLNEVGGPTGTAQTGNIIPAGPFTYPLDLAPAAATSLRATVCPSSAPYSNLTHWELSRLVTAAWTWVNGKMGG